MTTGKLVRNLVGPYERKLCALYRGVFINLDRVASQIAHAFPRNSKVIDVGGGDGELLNRLLRMRTDMRVVMLDLQSDIGRFLDDDVRPRVQVHGGTSMAEYRAAHGQDADAILISDVVHHVPVAMRESFFADAAALLKPGGTIVVKDIEPHGFTARMSLLADRYISGDKAASLIGSHELVALVTRVTGLQASESMLSGGPNYAVSFIP